MRTLAAIIAGIVVLLATVLGRTDITNADDTFTATLTGDQEVPPVDTQTTGRVKIRINDDITAGEFTLTVNNGVRVQQAHIHGELRSNGDDESGVQCRAWTA